MTLLWCFWYSFVCHTQQCAAEAFYSWKVCLTYTGDQLTAMSTKYGLTYSADNMTSISWQRCQQKYGWLRLLFVSRITIPDGLDLSLLPPCQSSLLMHARWANYTSSNVDVDASRAAYFSAIKIKQLISCMHSFEDMWPPTTDDFVNLACDITHMPVLLFNILAWMVGASDEVCCDNYVSLKDECKYRLYSIAQDIVYIESKGRIQPPEHLSLGLTVRQYGSSRLIDLLNSFGHCISHSVVLQ